MQILGLPILLAIPFAVVFGTSLGFINGFTVVKSGVHSFIITLATMSIFFGVMIFLTKANAYNGLPPEVQAFGKMKFFKTISPLLLISIVMCLFLAVFYKMTTLGRQMLAAGANPMAGHLGQDWLLPAFLAPVLGGTLLSGGRVSVIGTLLGAGFVNVMTSGLLLMRVGEFWILASLGAMLLVAVLVDRARQQFLKTKGMI